MGYLPPSTIADTLRRIQTADLVLPAIQREYVWEPKQLIALFDSLMRGYPIGGFLSWKIQPETVEQFRFYGFLKDYSEFDNRHCPAVDVPPRPVTALLDGQQRLTSLSIGLRGSYAYRISGGWRTKPSSYPTRWLYLNVHQLAPENEAGLKYDLRLLTQKQVDAFVASGHSGWFRVSDMYGATKMADIWRLAAERGWGNDPAVQDMLSGLWEAVHATQSLHFYEEDAQDVERVLDIFIRVNSGGTVLSYSDLLLSIATAQWKERDARATIHTLVDNLNAGGQGFNFSQDAVLKAGLVLAGIGDFAFRVKNFNATNMAILHEEWDRIADSLQLAAGFLSDLGLSHATLPADSVLIPVAYYLRRRNLGESYRTSRQFADDRELLRSWVLRSLVQPGVWGSGLDTLLRDIRQTIDEFGEHAFPLTEIEQRMAARGKALVLNEGMVDDLLNLRYGQKRTFAFLAMLFPNVDTRNVHHVDHVFPKALLYRNKLRRDGLDEAEIDEVRELQDQLPNLQLLEGPENMSKSSSVPSEWVDRVFDTPERRSNYLERNAMPWVPTGAGEFKEFFLARRARLADLIRDRLTVERAPSAATHVPSQTYNEEIESDRAEPVSLQSEGIHGEASPIADAPGEQETVFVIGRDKVAKAVMRDRFTVLGGSRARRWITPGTSPSNEALQRRLIDDGYLGEQGGDGLVFVYDCEFSSSSAAASVVVGSSASGPREWRVEGSDIRLGDWQAANGRLDRR